jgi:pyruvate,water dikinase
MTELIKNFNEIGREDAGIAGGKGASLGEMTQVGISVPPGFVILSSAFEKFLEETDLNVEIDTILHITNHKEIHTIEKASKEITALILSKELPQDIAKEIQKFFKNLGAKFVAVRSSATAEDSASAAWAGQLESYLNTTEENLLENVKKCWASLFTPRAIFYRSEKDLHKQKISVAVVVQKMVESEKSGIAFSVHPVTQDRNQLIIEAGFGLGEAIVSGQITPDSYVVEKQPRRIIDKNIEVQTKGLYRANNVGNEWRDISKAQGEKQILSDEEILELSGVILKIENHYSFPCDIEWAFENRKFYIVQSRPITTLTEFDSRYEKENWLVVVSFKTELLTEAIIHRGYRESLPQLLPQIPKFRNRMIVDNDIYIDLNETSKIQTYFSTETIKRAGKVYKRIEDQSKKFIKIARAVVTNSEKLSDKKLSERIKGFLDEYQNTIGAIGVPTIIDLVVEEKLKNILQQGGISKIEGALASLAIPYKQVETSKEKDDLLTIADTIRSEGIDLESKKIARLIRKHYENYGWLHSTLFLGNLYTEKEIKTELQKILTKPAGQKKIMAQEREIHLAEAKEIIKKINSSEGKALAEFFQKSVYYRTARLEWMNKACFIARPLLEECAKRLDIAFDDLIYLLPTELISSVENGKILNEQEALVRERQNGYAFISDNNQEYVLVVGHDLALLKSKFSKEHEASAETIRGITAFKGIARGKVVIVKDRSELHMVEQGDILVTRLTTPDFVIAMKKAAAIVTDLGGITSHAAVTSRELKIPCVVGTKNSTKILKRGDMVEVDADQGIIKIL